MNLDEMIDYAVSGDADWVFFRIMKGADREAFDNMLVASRHPLAYEPGTTERRFRQYIKVRKQEV